MTYTEVSEKIDQILAKIAEKTSQSTQQRDYNSDIDTLVINNNELHEYARKIIRYVNQSDLFSDELVTEVTGFFRGIENICEGTTIFANELKEYNNTSNPQISLSEIGKSLETIKSEIQYCEQLKSYSDVINKVTLIEEKYQDGKVDDRVATKNLARLKNLEILKNPNPNFSNLQTAILSLLNAYEQEMQKFPIETSEYTQNDDVDKNISDELEFILNQLEQLIDRVDLSSTLQNYNPELEEFIRQHSIFTQFIASDISFKEHKNEASNRLSNLSSQALIAYDVFKIIKNTKQNNESILLDFSNFIQRFKEYSAQLTFQTVEDVLITNDKQAKTISSYQTNIPDTILSQYGNCFNEQATISASYALNYAKINNIMPTNQEEFSKIFQMSVINVKQNKYLNLRTFQEQK